MLQGHNDHLVLLDHKDHPVHKGRLAHNNRLDLQQDTLVEESHPVHHSMKFQVSLLNRHHQDILALKDRPGRKDHPDLMDHPDHKDHQVLMDLLDRKDHPAHKVHQALMDHQDLSVLKDQVDQLKDTLVQAVLSGPPFLAVLQNHQPHKVHLLHKVLQAHKDHLLLMLDILELKNQEVLVVSRCLLFAI